MPTIAKLPSGSWRAQVRRTGRYVSETFLRRDDALRWSRLAELSVDRNETPVSGRIGRLTKFGELVRLHIEVMTAVGKGKSRRLGSASPYKRISSVGKVRPLDPRGSPGDSVGWRSRMTLARARVERSAMQEHSSALPRQQARRWQMELSAQSGRSKT